MKIKSHYPQRTLEESLLIILKASKSSPLSVQKILNILSGKGKPLLLLFLCLPFCQPIQIPGLSTPFGIAIACVSISMLFKKPIWAPKKLLNKTLSFSILKKIIDKGLWLITKIKRFTHPRLSWMCTFPLCRIANAALIVFWGVFLALPLPILFTNLIAGWAIFLISFGLLEDDGALVIASYLLTFLSIFLVFLSAEKLFF